MTFSRPIPLKFPVINVRIFINHRKSMVLIMKTKPKIRKKMIAIICTAVLFLSVGKSADIAVAAREAEPAAASEETAEPAASPDCVTISLAGDCSLGKLSIHGYSGTFYEMYDLHGASCFFKNVKEIFAEDDMTLINFEGVLTDASTATPKQFNIRGKPEFNQILVEGAIDAVSFGNNHNMDYGLQSMQDTIAAFAQVGIPYACNDTPGIYETENGIRIGFVSVNEVYDGTAVETYLQNGIAALQAQDVNLILACCHWGEEMEHYPEDYQTELGHKCIDWGADLVVGCHPHVLQGIELYNGKYIIYSLGNFCFGGNKNPKNKDTMILQATFPVTDGTVSKEAQLKIIPCTISSVSDRNDYCPTVADPERAASIIQKMNAYSEPFGITIDQAGGVAKTPPAKTQNTIS